MARIFPFLFSLLAHAAWRRSGRAGGVPPFKVPGKNTTRLPMPSSWQIMMISWVLERLWQTFGDDVKHKLTHTKSPSVNKLGQMIPAPSNVAPVNHRVPQAPQAPSPVQPMLQPNPVNAQPQATAQAPSQPAPQPAAKTYNTQKLPQDPLPPGSVLGSLRSS